jgi:hypothetical protein
VREVGHVDRRGHRSKMMEGKKETGTGRPDVESAKMNLYKQRQKPYRNQVLGLLGYRVLGNLENQTNMAKPEDLFGNVLMLNPLNLCLAWLTKPP